ncbi:cell division protein SepF [Streptococcus mitis]|nr:cell division protein SepF [Streptococcus sp. NLN64]
MEEQENSRPSTKVTSLLQNKASDGTLSLPQKSPVHQSLDERETQIMNTSRPQNITDLHAKQEELARQNGQPSPEDKHVIYVRYPRRYEETPKYLDLLIRNESVLIDFQYMTEVQARRCLDYLDGARYVLSGDLKKVANGIYLLTPANVIINVEDLQVAEGTNNQNIEFDFDMKRR